MLNPSLNISTYLARAILILRNPLATPHLQLIHVPALFQHVLLEPVVDPTAPPHVQPFQIRRDCRILF